MLNWILCGKNINSDKLYCVVFGGNPSYDFKRRYKLKNTLVKFWNSVVGIKLLYGLTFFPDKMADNLAELWVVGQVMNGPR